MQSSSLTSRDHISEAAAVYPPDISQMIKWRDSSYAADLYIAAVSWLDLFTYLDGHPVTEEELRLHFSLRERPTRTMVRPRIVGPHLQPIRPAARNGQRRSISEWQFRRQHRLVYCNDEV